MLKVLHKTENVNGSHALRTVAATDDDDETKIHQQQEHQQRATL